MEVLARDKEEKEKEAKEREEREMKEVEAGFVILDMKEGNIMGNRGGENSGKGASTVVKENRDGDCDDAGKRRKQSKGFGLLGRLVPGFWGGL